MKFTAAILSLAAAIWTGVDSERFMHPQRLVPGLEERFRAEREAAKTERELARVALRQAAVLSMHFTDEKLKRMQEARWLGWSFALVFAVLGIVFWCRPEAWVSTMLVLGGVGFALAMFAHVSYIPLPALFAGLVVAPIASPLFQQRTLEQSEFGSLR